MTLSLAHIAAMMRSIFHVLKIEFLVSEDSSRLISLRISEVKIGYDVPRHLSCVSLTFHEGKLFCFGGNTGVRSKKIVDQFEKNNDLLIMDLESSSFETDVTPEILKKRMAVHGATSHWVDSETLLISGGSEAPLGEIWMAQ